VLRVAGTYVVVAGSLMQAGAVVLPAFELPASAMRLMIYALAAGFPLAVLLAWLLDISPRGIRLARRRLRGAGAADDEGADAPAEASVFARSLEMILLGLALPVLGFALVLIVMSWRSDGDALVRAATTAGAEDGGASLAVLPLVDLSGDGADGGFFARGMHEDLLTQLSRVPSLKLISRTSVMTYAGSNKSLREIGRELGVDHVLEGSVRRSPDRVRVTVQLIRTDSDAQVWAERFDAELADVFAVQTRIATAIARALERELAPDGPAARSAGPVVPAAYDAYQKARDLRRALDPADRTAFDAAQRLYEEARRLDDRFAPAWLALATLHAEARWFGLDGSAERVEQARRCLERARALASPEDRLALAEGIFAYYVDRDYGKALLFFDDAARLAPGDPEVHFYRAMILRRRGELAGALAAERRALELDPLNLAHRDEHALTLALAGELAAARAELDSILRLDPGRSRAQIQRWQLELELDGRPADLLERLLALDRTRWLEPHFAMLELAAILAGRPGAALDALEHPAEAPFARARLDYRRAVLERHAGHADRALALAQAAQDAYASAGVIAATPLEQIELRQFEAMLAAESGALDHAVELQRRNVEAIPVEGDLIGGGPALWLLAELELRAGQTTEAIGSLERLASRVALGSVPLAGHYVLRHAPDFAAAREDPAFAALLARLRPAYADAWPAGD